LLIRNGSSFGELVRQARGGTTARSLARGQNLILMEGDVTLGSNKNAALLLSNVAFTQAHGTTSFAN
jgi:hypothetical protein